MWYLGELLVGPARALFMDEISNGLDSSTTFRIVNSIRQRIHILEGTALISLLQPAPETYELFDDIILLSDGKIVYQGPRENVLEFFERLGFECPKRKAVADFLQEVCFHLPQLWKPCWKFVFHLLFVLKISILNILKTIGDNQKIGIRDGIRSLCIIIWYNIIICLSLGSGMNGATCRPGGIAKFIFSSLLVKLIFC